MNVDGLLGAEDTGPVANGLGGGLAPNEKEGAVVVGVAELPNGNPPPVDGRWASPPVEVLGPKLNGAATDVGVAAGVVPKANGFASSVTLAGENGLVAGALKVNGEGGAAAGDTVPWAGGPKRVDAVLLKGKLSVGLAFGWTSRVGLSSILHSSLFFGGVTGRSLGFGTTGLPKAVSVTPCPCIVIIVLVLIFPM